MNVPPKVRNFLWCVCCDCIPTTIALKSRHVEIHDVCCFCNGNSENALHLFVLCPFASSVWRASIVGMFRGTAGSFKD